MYAYDGVASLKIGVAFVTVKLVVTVADKLCYNAANQRRHASGPLQVYGGKSSITVALSAHVRRIVPVSCALSAATSRCAVANAAGSAPLAAEAWGMPASTAATRIASKSRHAACIRRFNANRPWA